MRNDKFAGPAYTIQIVSNALDMLELLAMRPANPSLGRLAGSLNLTRNKAYRLLSTLCERGLVEQDPETGTYAIGVAALELAQRLIRQAPVVNHAHPIMEELARKHDEAVYMTVLRGDDVVFLDMVDCERQVKAMPLIGRRFPYFTNAAGKAIKALEGADPLNLLKKRGRKNNSLDVGSLLSELHEIRHKGVAVDCGGLGDGIVSVAVAVRDYAGKVVGAITMLVPSFRAVADRLESEIIPSLQEGADLLSMKLGHGPC
ncbi:IclR family transcriptional regulator [Geobacter sp. 60473]|uniref:IclR family transcriptional regulator n=1 Tax=Geobacter sp. 60473 TaxID=3080755 RepID=UPI002B30AAE2|nr:IclR family transcriptional regulator [Geobacter sp. 60473]